MVEPISGQLFIINTFNFCRNISQLVISASYLVLLFNSIAIAQTDPTPTKQDISQTPKTTPAIIPQATSILPVGLNVNGKSVLPSMNVRGKEDGEKAVDLDLWLVPWDDVVAALKLKVKEPVNGQIEIVSPLFKFKLDATKLTKDPNLGTVIAIKDLNTIPGVTAKFDINKYAIDLIAPTIDRKSTDSIVEQPIIFDDLPIKTPGIFGVGAIEQRVNISSQNGSSITPTGELKIVGNIFDANWYLRIDQSQLGDVSKWNIANAVVTSQKPQQDLVIGSQTPFWNRQGVQGSYWGATAIWRSGFTPPVQLSGGDFSVTDRLQSARVARSISGRAQPGTLVQLVRGSERRVLQEFLVDSSGIYRFDNVIIGSGDDDTFGREYQVLLYPNGQLTANPEIQKAQFSTVPGQIPAGSSAFVVSGGTNRIASGNFGSFEGVRGGLLYRRGVSESLTVGVGTISDTGVAGIGEVFWQPNNIPLQVAASATTGDRWNVLGRLSYLPSPDFSLTANLDQLSTRGDLSLRLTPSLTSTASYDNIRGGTIGGQYSIRDPDGTNATSLRAEIDTQARLRWSVNQKLNKWQLSHQSNDSATNSQITYQFNPKSNDGSELVATYQTNNSSTTTPNFSSLVWRYRSADITPTGRNRWQSELGYGFNNLGSGLIINLEANLVTGLNIRGSYRGAADNGGSSFALELTTNLLTTDRLQATDIPIDDLRNLGQIQVRAFLDKNGNGRQDPGEESYTDPLLFKLNQRSIDRMRPQIEHDTITLKLVPKSYRLDLDPAGFPVNYRSSIEAIRVDVVAGNTNSISIPLVPAYAYTGVVSAQNGKPLQGATVEAISVKYKTKITSVTNDSGVYYLEGLEQGEYILKVNDLPTTPDRLRITATARTTQELNLTVTIPTENPPPPPANQPVSRLSGDRTNRYTYISNPDRIGISIATSLYRY